MKGLAAVKVDTKEKIIRAFWELYKKNRIEKITVKSITDACGIYRTTFYLHFADVYAVLEQIENTLLKEIRDITLEHDSPTRTEYEKLMTKLSLCFTDNFDYLCVLLDGKHDPEFARLYKMEMISHICTVHQIDLSGLDEEMKEIAVRSLEAMIDLFLKLGDSPDISFDRLMYVVDGYMKHGIIRTLSKL